MCEDTSSQPEIYLTSTPTTPGGRTESHLRRTPRIGRPSPWQGLNVFLPPEMISFVIQPITFGTGRRMKPQIPLVFDQKCQHLSQTSPRKEASVKKVQGDKKSPATKE